VELRSRGRASDLLNWLDLGVDLLITLNIHHELSNLVYRTRDNNSPLHLDHGDRVCARSRRRMIVRRFGDRFRMAVRAVSRGEAVGCLDEDSIRELGPAMVLALDYTQARLRKLLEQAPDDPERRDDIEPAPHENCGDARDPV
jgi:hypothetical protein